MFILFSYFYEVLYLLYHTQNRRGGFVLYYLIHLAKTKSLHDELLVLRRLNRATNFLNLNCCHTNYLLIRYTLSVEYGRNTNTTILSYHTGVAEFTESLNGCLNQVVRVGRTLRLGKDILDTNTLKYGTHSTTGFYTRTGRCRLQIYFGAAKLAELLVRNGSVQNRYLNKVLLGGFRTLGDGCCYLTCLTQTVANDTITVTYYYNGCKRKSTTTFGNFRYTVYSNEALLELQVICGFNSVHILTIILEFETAFTSGISKLFNTTVIEITVAVKYYRLNACLLGGLGNSLTYDSCFLCLGSFFLDSQRRCRCQRCTLGVVNYLCINLAIRTEYSETRTLSSAEHLGADALLDFQSSFYFLIHNCNLLKIIYQPTYQLYDE